MDDEDYWKTLARGRKASGRLRVDNVFNKDDLSNRGGSVTSIAEWGGSTEVRSPQPFPADFELFVGCFCFV